MDDFDPETSLTWKWLPEHRNNVLVSGYGSGIIFGEVGEDRMCMAQGQMCADTHRIASVFSEKGLDFMWTDGIMGLGKRRYNDYSRTYIESLYASKAIKKQIFSLSLNMEKDSGSKLTLGDYDLHAFAKGPIKWHKSSIDRETWALNLTNITFGEEPLYFNFDAGVLPDTGSSVISLPQATYDHFI